MRTLSLAGHLGGADVAALVDGQLPPDAEERAWQHALACPGCRRQVESEGWTRTQLRALPAVERAAAPSNLVGALYALQAWDEVDRIERRSVRRRAVAAAVGVGSVGVAVVGLVALSSPPAGRGEVPGPAPAMIRSDLVGPSVGALVGTGSRTGRQQPTGRAAR
jgi:anti-sigma factor RsiW